MRPRILLGTLFGAVGGFFGFLLQEGLVPHDAVLQTPLREQLVLGMLVGSMLGIAIGAVEGTVIGSPRVLLRGAVLGCIIGAAGGMLGIYLGGIAFNWALFGRSPSITGPTGILDFGQVVLARAIGWSFLGALPGLAAGAATLSRKRALHGLIGGLLGGFIGGLVFDLVATVIAQPLEGAAAGAAGRTGVIEIGGISRAVGFTTIGGLAGLFIGLVEELMKQAWVRVLAGRNEGRDYILSKSLVVIGRDERADIPVFGDPTLAPQHAAIRAEQGRHVLLDGGAPPHSLVNGQPVTEQLLRDGDMVQLGTVRLLFREKATALRVGRPATDAPLATSAQGAIAMPSHLCPFCGAQKDAQGHCLCSVPGASGAAASAGAAADASTAGPFGAPPPYAADGVGTRLAALQGPCQGQVFPLAADNTSVGRDPGSDIALTADTTVSRRHARIVAEAGRHTVYDEGSTNGTFVNNVRVTVQALAVGDVLQIGATHLRYE